MLVINRHPGKAIIIAGEIRVVILDCGKRGVRIGIEAPAHIGIVREEIANQIADENRRATNVDIARRLLGQGGAADRTRSPASPTSESIG
jgi:carbon storage regulator